MRLYAMLVVTIIIFTLPLGACRVTSMVFKTFSRSITIRNDRLAEMLIAYKNTWGIATSPENRNKMSLLGVFSYIVYFPLIVCLVYDWWVYITSETELGTASGSYGSAIALYYIIAVSIKITEANKFKKGKIW